MTARGHRAVGGEDTSERKLLNAEHAAEDSQRTRRMRALTAKNAECRFWTEGLGTGIAVRDKMARSA
jgi:hypothetical protein